MTDTPNLHRFSVTHTGTVQAVCKHVDGALCNLRRWCQPCCFILLCRHTWVLQGREHHNCVHSPGHAGRVVVIERGVRAAPKRQRQAHYL